MVQRQGRLKLISPILRESLKTTTNKEKSKPCIINGCLECDHAFRPNIWFSLDLLNYFINKVLYRYLTSYHGFHILKYVIPLSIF